MEATQEATRNKRGVSVTVAQGTRGNNYCVNFG